MKIKSATFQNYRGITNLGLEFSPKTNVLAGVNGVGKSAVLDGLANLLESWVYALDPGTNIGSADIEDIRIGAEHASLGIHVEVEGKDFEWDEVKSRHQKTRKAKSKRTLPFFPLIGTAISEDVRLPLVVHYDSKRAALEVPLRLRAQPSKGIFGDAFESRSKGGVDFRSFFSWFRDREDLENETRVDTPTFVDAPLDAVRRAIERFTSFDRLRVRRQAPMRMTLQKLGTVLSVNQLSDGERNLLALVGDIARRLSLLNLKGNVDAILAGEGVVLIDEIELHLHPKWQREVISKLETTFPNCQFILTTHSPQVLSHVHEENIWILRLNGEGTVEAARPQASYGLDSNRILEDIMDVPKRPQEAKDQIELLFRLLSVKDRSRAENEMASISARYGDLPELAQARALLRRQDLIGR